MSSWECWTLLLLVSLNVFFYLKYFLKAEEIKLKSILQFDEVRENFYKALTAQVLHHIVLVCKHISIYTLSRYVSIGFILLLLEEICGHLADYCSTSFTR